MLTRSSRVGPHHGLILLQKVVMHRLLTILIAHSTLRAARDVETFAFPPKYGGQTARSNILGEHVVIPLNLRSSLANEILVLDPFLTNLILLHL